MTPIVPESMQSLYDDWKMSPAIRCNGLVFLTGFNGAAMDGSVSSDPEVQIRQAFSQVALVLAEGGLDFGDVVEMTSYHVGLRDHLALFRSIREAHVCEPYPAWTAIEVSGFATEGVMIELRIVARERSV